MTRILALLLVLVTAVSADACHRCGRFGRGCRYHHPVIVAAPVVAAQPYVAPASQTNIVINGSIPPYLLAPQANSVYGGHTYQAQAQAYAPNNAAYMDAAARFTDRAFTLAETGQSGFKESLDLKMAYDDAYTMRLTNAQMFYAALTANQAAPSPQKFRATVEGGKLSFEKADANGEFTAVGQNSLLMQRCANCHSKGGAKGGLAVDGTQPVLDRSVRRFNEIFGKGVNVPEAMKTLVQGMSPQDKGKLLEELLALPAEGVTTELPPTPNG